MTLEIRQMVIKSSIDQAGAGKRSTEKPAADDGCGDCDSGQGSSAERLRMRASLMIELERLRER